MGLKSNLLILVHTLSQFFITLKASTGDKAIGCITNGAILTVGGNMLGLQTGTIGKVVNFLAKPTGCDGIVNMDQIQTVSAGDALEGRQTSR